MRPPRRSGARGTDGVDDLGDALPDLERGAARGDRLLARRVHGRRTSSSSSNAPTVPAGIGPALGRSTDPSGARFSVAPHLAAPVGWRAHISHRCSRSSVPSRTSGFLAPDQSDGQHSGPAQPRPGAGPAFAGHPNTRHRPDPGSALSEKRQIGRNMKGSSTRPMVNRTPAETHPGQVTAQKDDSDQSDARDDGQQPDPPRPVGKRRDRDEVHDGHRTGPAGWFHLSNTRHNDTAMIRSNRTATAVAPGPPKTLTPLPRPRCRPEGSAAAIGGDATAGCRTRPRRCGGRSGLRGVHVSPLSATPAAATLGGPGRGGNPRRSRHVSAFSAHRCWCWGHRPSRLVRTRAAAVPAGSSSTPVVLAYIGVPSR